MGKQEHEYPLIMTEACANTAWFAIRVRSNREQMVSGLLAYKGVEEYLPTYKVSVKWSDRTKTHERALFPGYVFCRLDPRYRMPVLTTPGVMHFVGIGRTPVPVLEWELAQVRTVVQSGLATTPWRFLEAGQRVYMDSGPLAGCEGILESFRGSHRLIVSIGLLKRSIAVEVEGDWIRPAQRAAQSAQPQAILRTA